MDTLWTNQPIANLYNKDSDACCYINNDYQERIILSCDYFVIAPWHITYRLIWDWQISIFDAVWKIKISCVNLYFLLLILNAECLYEANEKRVASEEPSSLAFPPLLGVFYAA